MEIYSLIRANINKPPSYTFKISQILFLGACEYSVGTRWWLTIQCIGIPNNDYVWDLYYYHVVKNEEDEAAIDDLDWLLTTAHNSINLLYPLLFQILYILQALMRGCLSLKFKPVKGQLKMSIYFKLLYLWTAKAIIFQEYAYTV